MNRGGGQLRDNPEQPSTMEILGNILQWLYTRLLEMEDTELKMFISYDQIKLPLEGVGHQNSQPHNLRPKICPASMVYWRNGGTEIVEVTN